MASVASAPAAVLTAVTGLPTPDSLLPVLEPVKSREQYRERPEGETEEVSSVSFRKTLSLHSLAVCQPLLLYCTV